VIFHSSKEAAIMRVQGTTKRRTRAILALEQTLLCAAGLLIGGGALVVYNGAGLFDILTKLAVFAAMYFAVIALAAFGCSVAATSKNMLELLQTRE
jgi:ABC-type antimicrobial peptide transport system permease subunit